MARAGSSLLLTLARVPPKMRPGDWPLKDSCFQGPNSPPAAWRQPPAGLFSCPRGQSCGRLRRALPGGVSPASRPEGPAWKGEPREWEGLALARFTPRGHALGTCLEEEHVPPVLGVAARGTASCARGAAEPASAAGGVQPRPRLGAQHPLLLIPELGGGPAPRSRAVCSPPHPGPRHLPHRTAGQREPSTARGGRLAQGSWANPPCHTGRRKKEKLSQEEHRLVCKPVRRWGTSGRDQPMCSVRGWLRPWQA